MEEVWKDIDGYEGLYQISNFGRVKSLGRWVERGKQGCRFEKEQLIKPNKNSRGYLSVGLHKNGKRQMCSVHRLVAEAFLDNPNNLPEVNHKDENKQNNCVWNLEFCTHKYNNSYGTRIVKIIKSNTNHPNLSKKVFQYDLDGNFIREFPSLMEVHRQLGYSQSNISRCCRGEFKHMYNYIWKYVS